MSIHDWWEGKGWSIRKQGKGTEQLTLGNKGNQCKQHACFLEQIILESELCLVHGDEFAIVMFLQRQYMIVYYFPKHECGCGPRRAYTVYKVSQLIQSLLFFPKLWHTALINYCKVWLINHSAESDLYCLVMNFVASLIATCRNVLCCCPVIAW